MEKKVYFLVFSLNTKRILEYELKYTEHQYMTSKESRLEYNWGRKGYIIEKFHTQDERFKRRKYIEDIIKNQ